MSGKLTLLMRFKLNDYLYNYSFWHAGALIHVQHGLAFLWQGSVIYIYKRTSESSEIFCVARFLHYDQWGNSTSQNVDIFASGVSPLIITRTYTCV